MKYPNLSMFRTVITTVIGVSLIFGSEPLARFIGDPSLAVWGGWMGFAALAVALSHVLRKVLFHYIDLEEFSQKALQSPIGSAIVFLGVCIVVSAFVIATSGSVRAEGISSNAQKYLPVLVTQQCQYWPDISEPHALPGQIEQESNWNPRAELKTSREHGIGLGQITKTDKFDSLAELKGQYPKALSGWSWGNPSIYDPIYQIRGLLLMDLRNYQTIIDSADEHERLAFTFAAYNGGLGGLVSDRRMCAGTKGCDQSRWFGNVEKTSLKSKKAVGGYDKSFFSINRSYVTNVLLVKSLKYSPYMGCTQ